MVGKDSAAVEGLKVPESGGVNEEVEIADDSTRASSVQSNPTTSREPSLNRTPLAPRKRKDVLCALEEENKRLKNSLLEEEIHEKVLRNCLLTLELYEREKNLDAKVQIVNGRYLILTKSTEKNE